MKTVGVLFFVAGLAWIWLPATVPLSALIWVGGHISLRTFEAGVFFAGSAWAFLAAWARRRERP